MIARVTSLSKFTARWKSKSGETQDLIISKKKTNKLKLHGVFFFEMLLIFCDGSLNRIFLTKNFGPSHEGSDLGIHHLRSKKINLI